MAEITETDVDVNKYTYEVTEDTDTRTGEKIYLTKVVEKLSREEYIKVNQYIKSLGGYRHVPINTECRKYLERQLELKDIVKHKRPKEQNDYLFVTSYNTPLNSQIYSDSIKAVVKQINLTKSFNDEFPVFSGHTFRHTFATRCFEAGVQPKVVQSYLGHASLKMTMDLYTHVTDDKASVDIERIVNKTPNKVVDFVKKCV